MEGELALANQFSSETTANPLSSDLAALITSLNAAIPQLNPWLMGQPHQQISGASTDNL